MRRLPLIALLALAACSPQAAQGNSTAMSAPAGKASSHPISGLEVVPLTITQNGKAYRFRVEVARSNEEQRQGLMFRTQMGADEGMIFPYDPPEPVGFWMKNTVIPLDIIFIGTDRRIINIEANAVPYSLDPRRSQGLAIAVLELNGGRAQELGIGPGAKVDW
jgi:hypothetical protein